MIMTRNSTASVLLLAGLALLAGCVLTSGQIVISFEIDDATITATGVDGVSIDLNENSDYEDHKDDLEGLADLAIVGAVTNEGAALNVEAWMTNGETDYATDAEVRANGIRLWGPFALGAGETKTIGWDESADLFPDAGKAALLEEIQGDGGADGDGRFTLYLLGSGGTYEFSVEDGALVLVLDAGL
jgi:hypothetical protein